MARGAKKDDGCGAVRQWWGLGPAKGRRFERYGQFGVEPPEVRWTLRDLRPPVPSPLWLLLLTLLRERPYPSDAHRIDTTNAALAEASGMDERTVRRWLQVATKWTTADGAAAPLLLLEQAPGVGRSIDLQPFVEMVQAWRPREDSDCAEPVESP